MLSQGQTTSPFGLLNGPRNPEISGVESKLLKLVVRAGDLLSDFVKEARALTKEELCALVRLMCGNEPLLNGIGMTRWAISRILSAAGAKAIPLLVNAMESLEVSRDGKLWCLHTFGHMKEQDNKAIEICLSALKSDDKLIRLHAVDAIHQMIRISTFSSGRALFSEADIASALIEVLERDDADLYAHAAVSLALLESKPAVPVLAKRLHCTEKSSVTKKPTSDTIASCLGRLAHDNAAAAHVLLDAFEKGDSASDVATTGALLENTPWESVGEEELSRYRVVDRLISELNGDNKGIALTSVIRLGERACKAWPHTLQLMRETDRDVANNAACFILRCNKAGLSVPIGEIRLAEKIVAAHKRDYPVMSVCACSWTPPQLATDDGLPVPHLL